MKRITIEKLIPQEHDGDWHDKPLRWRVAGPSREVQKFSTKKEATMYRRIRRKASCAHDAVCSFSSWPDSLPDYATT